MRDRTASEGTSRSNTHPRPFCGLSLKEIKTRLSILMDEHGSSTALGANPELQSLQRIPITRYSVKLTVPRFQHRRKFQPITTTTISQLIIRFLEIIIHVE